MASRRAPRWLAWALVGVLGGSSASRADEEPAAPPAPEGREQGLARAKELRAQVADLHRRGQFAEALPLAREALALRERYLAPDDPALGVSLNDLSLLLQAEGSLPEARAMLERAVAVAERAHGPEHVDVGLLLTNLALLLRAQGVLAEAGRMLERALPIVERARGAEHPEVALVLNAQALVLYAQDDYAHARARWERALLIRERALGADHPSVAETRNNLGTLLLAQGAYGDARLVFEQALAVWERTRGPQHPDVASGLINVATVARLLGDYGAARALSERALAIREKAFGPGHPDVAQALGGLASVLVALGAFTEARVLQERALAITEKTLGPVHPDVAVHLNDLGSLLVRLELNAQARPPLERAVAIREGRLGPDHPLVAQSLTNLGLLERQEGHLARARELLARALAVQERTLGADHREVAVTCNNLAGVLLAQGAAREAVPLMERALAVRLAVLGEAGAEVAQSLNNLAAALERAGEPQRALATQARALVAAEAYLRAQVVTLGPRQRLEVLRTLRYQSANWVRLAVGAGRTGYEQVLRFKGLLGRVERAERSLRREASPEDLRLIEDLRAAERRQARLANQIPPAGKQEARASWQRRYAEAGTERERLTQTLGARSAGLRGALARLDLGLGDVQAHLPEDAVLVDLLRVRDRYHAWVVRREGAVRHVDLGAAEPIEEAARALLEDTRRDAPSGSSAAALLGGLVWEPLGLDEGVRRVVLCPDAALVAVPFAALPGRAPGRVLLEELRIAHVMSATDVVPWPVRAAAGRGALLLGGVDYERAEVAGGGAAPAAERAALASRQAWTPLAETRAEVEALGRIVADGATLLLGGEATEARLRRESAGRRFVHIATHGFARDDLLAGLHERRLEDAWTSADLERRLAAGHDPMLLAGLALAGANVRDGGGGDDGILTALEASSLDLEGVELATLSACETARGTPESGEGVLGLVAAFQMAGARQVLASLWKVDDEATRLLMDGLYARLLRSEQPLSAADALRESALALREARDASGRTRFSSPSAWAAFVAYGRAW